MCVELTSEFQNAYATLKKNCNKVIVCHLIGLDIGRYNKASPQASVQDQEIINEAVCQINKNINKMNIDHEVKGPWLDDTIHAATCKKIIHKYKRLYKTRPGLILTLHVSSSNHGGGAQYYSHGMPNV